MDPTRSRHGDGQCELIAEHNRSIYDLTVDAAGVGPPSAGARAHKQIGLGWAHTVPQQQSQNTARSHLQAALTLSCTSTVALLDKRSRATSRRLLFAAA